MMSVEKVFDAVVIGGGVIGTATAVYLTRAGAKVCLVERGTVASGTTGATMGNLSLHNRMPGPWWDLAMTSRRLYQELSSETCDGFEFDVVSSLMLVESPADIEWAIGRVRTQREAGLDVEFIPGQDLPAIDRSVAKGLAGAVYCRPSARVNPFLLCRALGQVAQDGGAVVRCHTEATGILVRHGRVVGVATGTRKIPCRYVVNAAGPNADEVAAMAGVQLPIVRERGVLVVTERLPQVGVRIKGECTEGESESRDLDILTVRYGVHLVFSQTRSGNCLIGRSGESALGPERARFEAVSAILRRACRFIPVLAGVMVVRTFAGVRPFSPDLIPILGPVDEPAGFVAACGFGDKGVALGAAGAQLVARSIAEGPYVIPARFRPGRFVGLGSAEGVIEGNASKTTDHERA